MSCVTCGHTMERIDLAAEEESLLFLCPRCGTVKFEHPHGEPTVYVPKLVERCREFAREQLGVGPILDNSAPKVAWHRLGIAEAIHLPGDRPNG